MPDIRNFPVSRRYQLNDEGGFRRVPSRRTSLRGLSRTGWGKAAIRESAAAGALTRDGKTLAVADDNGHIYVWSMTSGKIIATAACQLPVNGTAGLAFSPDGRTVVAAGDQGKIYLWTIR